MTLSDANPDDTDDGASIAVEIFHTVDVENHMLVFGDNHHKWAMDFTDFDNLSVASTKGGITITTGVRGGPVRAAVTTEHPTGRLLSQQTVAARRRRWRRNPCPAPIDPTGTTS